MGSAGKSKLRVTIKRPTTALDDFNGTEVTYSTVATYWAQVSRLGGSRLLNQEETTYKRPYIITIRQYADIKEDDVIELDGEMLVIQSIERDLMRKRYQKIIATESYNG